MSDVYGAIIDTCKQFATLKRRIQELKAALKALEPSNEHADAVRCTIAVEQGTAWDVEVLVDKETARRAFEAALAAEETKLTRLRTKLDAAHKLLTEG